MDGKQQCVKLSVQPSRGLVDEKFVVLVQNALPGSTLTVHALHQCEDRYHWQAFAHYSADATGTVNGKKVTTSRSKVHQEESAAFFFCSPVSEDSSLGGMYSGVEPMGLLWGLKPVPGSKPGLRWVGGADPLSH